MGSIDPSDQYLMKKVRLGDHTSFKLLFERYWAELYIYAFNILGSRAICEDLVQEVFTDLWKKASQQDIRHPKAYLYKAVKFQTLSHIRGNSIHQKYLERFEVARTIQNLEDEINFNELDRLLTKAVKKLPQGCRKVFELSRVHCLTNKEIAEKLNISNQTVKNQISTALRHLRKTLDGAYLLFLVFLI